MGTGYTRNDTSNNIADGNVINASDLDGEYDAIESAFGTSGHCIRTCPRLCCQCIRNKT